MKKLFVICLAFLSNALLYAQDSMPTQEFVTGLRAGGNYSNMIFGNDFNYSAVNPKIGYNVGAIVRLDFINNPFELELGLLYSTKGAKIEGQNYTLSDNPGIFKLNRKYQLNYLDFPFTLNITTSNKKNWQVYVGGGIMVSMGSKGKVEDKYTSESLELNYSNPVLWEDSPEGHFHKADLSYVGQVGLRINKSLEFNASISQSLANVDPNNDFIKNSTITLSVIRVLNRRDVR